MSELPARRQMEEMRMKVALSLAFVSMAACSSGLSEPPSDLLASQTTDLLAPDLRQPMPVAQTVVILGSSTAAGVGASSPAKAWAGRLGAVAAERCPLTRITNLALGGYTTWHGMPVAAPRPAGRPASDAARNVEAALQLRPDLVMILFPSNDAASKFPLSETVANHTALRDRVRAAGAADLILGNFPRNFGDGEQVKLMTGLRDALPALGAPRHVALWAVLAASDTQVKAQYSAGDGIHLNDSGHALLAEQVLASAAWKAVCPALR